MDKQAEERRLVLELKKQKLAEIREDKKRRTEERRNHLLTPSRATNGESRPTFTPDDLNGILADCGINPEPARQNNNTDSSTSQESGLSPRVQRVSAASRLISLELSEIHNVTLQPKDNVSYSKTTQTDDEKFNMGEFSTGSQEFDYDDDMIPIESRDIHFDGSPTDHLDDLLPFYKRQQSEDKKAEVPEAAPVRVQDYTEEERQQIMASQEFRQFFFSHSKLLERALAETRVNIFVDYSLSQGKEKTESGELLTRVRIFQDEKWTHNRPVTAMNLSEIHNELLVVAYDNRPESEWAGDPVGVVMVWNYKFAKDTPEYLFTSQSRLTAIAFARFHPHLVIGACYSGRLCLWDFRADKKTPTHRSPLSLSAHTHPIYALSVVGSHNAHMVVSVSTDGKMCCWNIENLTQPMEGKELIGKQGRAVHALCIAFPPNDVNNPVVAGEDGCVYQISRHEATPADKFFEGHYAPVRSASFHPSSGSIDFSHVFLTVSMDWTIRLWSLKDPKIRLCFDVHGEDVFDVAWSPVHPAVFVSVDEQGKLFLWNLNEDIEAPVARLAVREEGGVGIRNVRWSENGQKLFIGLQTGEVWMYNVHEKLHTNVHQEEWTKFAAVLVEIKTNNEEADELADSSIGRSVY